MTQPTQVQIEVSERDRLGRLVREAWIRWATTQPNPKPSWLVPYDDLAEPDKEADRQIGEALTAAAQVGERPPHFWSGAEEVRLATIERCAQVIVRLIENSTPNERRRLEDALSAIRKLKDAP